MILWLGVACCAVSALWVAVMVLGPPLINRVGALPRAQLDPREALAGRTPQMTVVVPARNEEAAIGERIDNLLALDDPGGGVDVLVVSDGSTDATEAIARGRAEASGGRVQVLALDPNRGKEEAIGVARAHVRGDILALTDATTHWEPDVAVELVRALMLPGIGAASGKVLYRSRDGAVAEGFSVYQKVVVAQRQGGRRRALQVSTSGACSAAWTCLFDRYQGNMNSDLQLTLLGAERGLGTAYVAGAVAWEEPRTSLQEELKARQRIARLCLVSVPVLVRRLVAARAWWLLLQLAVTKFTRWAIWLPATLLPLGCVALAASAPGWLAGAAGAAAAGLLLAGLVGVARMRGQLTWLGRPGATLGYVAVAVAATASALVQVARGQRSLAWTPDR